ncbi:MAG: PEP-CTERM sorting domain-containing protein [Pirellulales bacterium]
MQIHTSRRPPQLATCLLLFATLSSGLPVACASTIVDADGHPLTTSLHPGAILDTSTNLLWLDNDETYNRSFNDVSNKLAPGGEFEGWRYATNAEVATLMANAGIADTNQAFTSAVFQPVADLLGVWGFRNWSGGLDGGRWAWWLTGEDRIPGKKHVGFVQIADVGTAVGTGRTKFTIASLAYDESEPETGSALVRSSLVPVTLPGDYSGNNMVDAADYSIWRDRLGSTNSLLNDDTPGVGQDDYVRWRTKFGQTLSSGPSDAASSVPEPSAMMLGAIGISLAIRRR